MKGISKNKRGISLIVLVITIIVMIILASAIILSLQSSGIIGRANEAKTKSDEATLREAASIKLAEYELGIQTGDIASTTTASEYVKEELEKDGIDTKGLAITPDGTIQTGLSEIAVKFVEAGVKVGDTVTGYDLSSNLATSHTTDGKENTAPDYTETDPTAQTVARGTELAWKYMGIDENGEALIVANSTGKLSTMKLSGKGGYLNGPAALDTACAALYSSDMGSARSMDWEDVTRLLEYAGHQGTYYDVGYNEIKTDKALTIGEIETKLGTKLGSRTTPDGSDLSNFKSDNVYLPKTSIDIKAGDREKSLVYQTTTYWLSSSCVDADFDSSYAYFDVRYVDRMSVDVYEMFYSLGVSDYGSYAVRPVVSLSSNVQMAYDGTTVMLSK